MIEPDYRQHEVMGGYIRVGGRPHGIAWEPRYEAVYTFKTEAERDLFVAMVREVMEKADRDAFAARLREAMENESE